MSDRNDRWHDQLKAGRASSHRGFDPRPQKSILPESATERDTRYRQRMQERLRSFQHAPYQGYVRESVAIDTLSLRTFNELLAPLGYELRQEGRNVSAHALPDTQVTAATPIKLRQVSKKGHESIYDIALSEAAYKQLQEAWKDPPLGSSRSSSPSSITR